MIFSVSPGFQDRLISRKVPGFPVKLSSPIETWYIRHHLGTRSSRGKTAGRSGSRVRLTCPDLGKSVSELTDSSTSFPPVVRMISLNLPLAYSNIATPPDTGLAHI